MSLFTSAIFLVLWLNWSLVFLICDWGKMALCCVAWLQVNILGDLVILLIFIGWFSLMITYYNYDSLCMTPYPLFTSAIFFLVSWLRVNILGDLVILLIFIGLFSLMITYYNCNSLWTETCPLFTSAILFLVSWCNWSLIFLAYLIEVQRNCARFEVL